MASLMVNLLEEQATLIHKHIGILKAFAQDANAAIPDGGNDGHKKKVKVPVDPNRPKRPLTGYQLFMADTNPSVKEHNPEANATVVMTMVANAWSSLGTEKKNEYLKKAEKLREDYLEDMKKYDATKVVTGDDAGAAVATSSTSTAAVPVKVKKAPKASSSATSSSSTGSSQSVAPVVAAPAPVVAVAPTPSVAASSSSERDGEERKSAKKHKRSESIDSEQVIFAPVNGAGAAASSSAPETDKKKKVQIVKLCCVLESLKYHVFVNPLFAN